MAVTKKEARDRAASIRRRLTGEYVAEASRRIASAFLELPEYRSAQTVLAYLNYGKEPETSEIIDAMWKAGKRVCIPLCVDTQEHIMEAKLYTPDTELVRGAYGIMEPSVIEPVIPPEDIDCVIVPCVACDESRNRLGHGAGYYDRYLVKTNAARICLCLDELVLEEVPTDEHDLAVDRIITENRVI